MTSSFFPTYICHFESAKCKKKVNMSRSTCEGGMVELLLTGLGSGVVHTLHKQDKSEEQVQSPLQRHVHRYP